MTIFKKVPVTSKFLKRFLRLCSFNYTIPVSSQNFPHNWPPQTDVYTHVHKHIFISLITLAQCYPNRCLARAIVYHSDVWWKIRDSLCLSRVERDVFFFIMELGEGAKDENGKKVLSFMEHWKMYAQIRKKKKFRVYLISFFLVSLVLSLIRKMFLSRFLSFRFSGPSRLMKGS